LDIINLYLKGVYIIKILLIIGFILLTTFQFFNLFSKIENSYQKGKQKAEIYTFINSAQQFEMIVKDYNKTNDNLIVDNNSELPIVLNQLSQYIIPENFEYAQQIFSNYSITKESNHYKYLNLKGVDSKLCNLIKQQQIKQNNLECYQSSKNEYNLKYKLTNI
jgi:hypothetical protein